MTDTWKSAILVVFGQNAFKNATERHIELIRQVWPKQLSDIIALKSEKGFTDQIISNTLNFLADPEGYIDDHSGEFADLLRKLVSEKPAGDQTIIPAISAIAIPKAKKVSSLQVHDLPMADSKPKAIHLVSSKGTEKKPREIEPLNRLEAMCLLFGDDTTSATQEAVDLIIQGGLKLSYEEKNELPECVLNQIRAFQDDRQLILDSIQDPALKALLEQLDIPVPSPTEKVPAVQTQSILIELPTVLMRLIHSRNWISIRSGIEEVVQKRKLQDFDTWKKIVSYYCLGTMGKENITFGEHMHACIEALERGEDPTSMRYQFQFVTGIFSVDDATSP